jgi:hypothetical protein
LPLILRAWRSERRTLYFPSTGSEFRQSNADAHRVRPTDFRAPALISHQAFWIVIPSQKDRKQARDRVKRKLDCLILRIASRLKYNTDNADVTIKPCVQGAAILFASTALPTCFVPFANHIDDQGNFDEAKLETAQKDVLESDHRVVSLHFKWNACDITARFEFHTEYFTISTFAELASCDREDLRDAITRITEARLAREVDAIKELVYDSFWKDLSDHICQELMVDPIFTRIFADFRGVVIANDTVLGRDTGNNLIENLLPLLIPLWFEHPTYECSVSYMLGGRALYITSLGPQTPERLTPRGSADRVPVTYLLCINGAINDWQRGRLVDLIHTAGVGRLASLKDLSALRKAGGELASLDHFTARARSAVSDQDTAAASSIREAHRQFNKITTDFNTNTKADYGVLYRVERSRYYVARFQESAAQMRILPVVGYHKYDQFVQQRLGSTFDFIDRLGRRYERSVAAFALLDGYQLTISSNEIALRQQANELVERGITNSIKKIQEYGEFALIAALIPYYVMGLLVHLYEGSRNREYLVYLTYVVWSSTFGLAMYRRRETEQRSIKDGLLWGAGALLFLVIGMSFTLPAIMDGVSACVALASKWIAIGNKWIAIHLLGHA